MKVLICNAGSSSIKFGLIEAERERLIAEAEIDCHSQPARPLQSGHRRDRSRVFPPRGGRAREGKVAEHADRMPELRLRERH